MKKSDIHKLNKIFFLLYRMVEQSGFIPMINETNTERLLERHLPLQIKGTECKNRKVRTDSPF